MKVRGAMRRVRVSRAAAVVVGGVASVALIAGIAPSALAFGPPSTPSSVSLVGGEKSITVSWNDASTGKITFTATAQASGRTTRSCTTQQNDCQIVSVENGAIYSVTVTAQNKAGSSTPSSELSVRVGVPGPPRMVKVKLEGDTLLVAWSPPRASGVGRITSYMATAMPFGFSCSTSGTILTQPGRACEIPGINPAMNYHVTVTATNSYGTGPPSNPTGGDD